MNFGNLTANQDIAQLPGTTAGTDAGVVGRADVCSRGQSQTVAEIVNDAPLTSDLSGT